jgi:hypothetical protein
VAIRALYSICFVIFLACSLISGFVFSKALQPQPGANMILIALVFILPFMVLLSVAMLILSFVYKKSFSRRDRLAGVLCAAYSGACFLVLLLA